MRKYDVILKLFLVVLVLTFPTGVTAVTTEGQIQFFESSTDSSSTEESTSETNQSTEETNTSTSSTGSKKAIDDTTKNKQRLLQTNDTINYSATIIGTGVLVLAIYKIRRNL